MPEVSFAVLLLNNWPGLFRSCTQKCTQNRGDYKNEGGGEIMPIMNANPQKEQLKKALEVIDSILLHKTHVELPTSEMMIREDRDSDHGRDFFITLKGG